MMRMIGHIPPDMTLSKAEIAADRAAWDALENTSKAQRAALLLALYIISDGAHGTEPPKGENPREYAFDAVCEALKLE